MIDLKKSYLVQLAEYAKLQEIEDEPAFAWWVPFVLKKRGCITSVVQSRVKKRTREYGILVPTTVEEAHDALCKHDKSTC